MQHLILVSLVPWYVDASSPNFSPVGRREKCYDTQRTLNYSSGDSWLHVKLSAVKKFRILHLTKLYLEVVSQTWRALKNNLAKICNARNNIYVLRMSSWNFVRVPKTRTVFQLEILIRRTILIIYKLRANILESSSNVSERPPRLRRSQNTVALTNLNLQKSIISFINNIMQIHYTTIQTQQIATSGYDLWYVLHLGPL